MLHQLEPGRPRKSYTVLFDSNEIVRADLASRNISIIDLSQKANLNKTEALQSFLEKIINSLRKFPIIPVERRWGNEAKSVVPQNIKIQLNKMGFEIMGCHERHVYCHITDYGQPDIVPPGFGPRAHAPTEYSKPEYMCIWYSRWDENMMNKWEGWAIGVRVP